MKRSYGTALLAPLAALALSVGEAQANPGGCGVAGNLVGNCGFETTTTWSPSGAIVTGYYHNGSGMGYLSWDNVTTVGQIINSLTIGETYDFSMWVKYFSADLGLTVMLGSDGWTTPPLTDTWSQVTHSFTASSSSELLSITLTGSSSYGMIDDVALVLQAPPPPPVPEPASAALLATGLAGLAGLRRRKR